MFYVDGRNRRLLRRLSLVSVVAAAAMMVVPGQALATHADGVVCGETVPHNTRVPNDLTDCPSQGLTITAPNITLDLAGHTIDGTGSNAGIENQGNNGVVIKNGVVREFLDGVVLSNGVMDNRVSALSLDGTSHAGIWLVFNSDANTVIRNSASSSVIVGILLEDDSDGNQVARNTLSSFDGISLATGSDNNRLIGNSSDTARFGMVVQNGVNGTQVKRNDASGNGNDGIFVQSLATNTLLEANDAHMNGDDGIDVQNSLTTLTRNSANNNFDWGIVAVAGVTDGGGNKATGNNGGGTGGQCLNVSC